MPDEAGSEVFILPVTLLQQRDQAAERARRRMSSGLDQGSADSVLLVGTFWLVYNIIITV